jgi:hypothetical protein
MTEVRERKRATGGAISAEEILRYRDADRR